MLDFSETFKALIGPDVFDTGGKLNPEQANTFIDYMVDEQIVLKVCDIHKMPTNQKNLDKLGIASRILRKRVVGHEQAGTAATTSQVVLSLTGTKLTVEVPYDSLRVNIERDRLVDHFMKICGTQIGNDLEDLGFNGDEASANEFIQIQDGWYKHALNANIYDTNASVDYLGVVFPGMVAAMPAKFKRRKGDLRLYVADSVLEAYIKQLAAAGYGAESYKFVTGENKPTYMGIPIEAEPYAVATKHILTDPKNLAFGITNTGILREMDRDIKKQVIIAVFSVDIDYQIREDTALVLAYDA